VSTTNSVAQVRKALNDHDLHRIHAAITDAADTRQLIETTLTILYAALAGNTGAEAGQITAARYAIPTSQWLAILTAVTNRAQAWGTAVPVGLEMALTLMPGHYHDPDVPAPDLDLADYRPAEHRLTVTRGAVDVIAQVEAHLGRLHTYYGSTSETYQTALHSWHRGLAGLFSMNSGVDTQVSADGELSLFVRTASGLVYGLIFHGADRHCTTDGCDALIDDDGTTRPIRDGAPVLDHDHTPSYPVGAPRPGVWSFHS
jgi:hypothetical protein